MFLSPVKFFAAVFPTLFVDSGIASRLSQAFAGRETFIWSVFWLYWYKNALATSGTRLDNGKGGRIMNPPSQTFSSDLLITDSIGNSLIFRWM